MKARGISSSSLHSLVSICLGHSYNHDIATKNPGMYTYNISRVPCCPITPDSHSPADPNYCACVAIIADNKDSFGSMSGDCLGNDICRIRPSHSRGIRQQNLAFWQLRHDIPYFRAVCSLVILGHPDKENVGRFVGDQREARCNSSASGQRDYSGVGV